MEDDEGEDVPVVEAPNPIAIAPLEKAWGRPLPAELRGFLHETRRVSAGLDLYPFGVTVETDFGLLLEAHDYGNGDRLLLEAAGERCHLWWVGHDPWFLVFWGTSIKAFLEAWVGRLESGVLPGGWEPTALAPTQTPFDFGLSADDDDAAWCDSLPDDSVIIDLRHAAPGTEVPEEVTMRCGDMSRRGLILAFYESS